jgi:DNA-directed RNA polymerase II subunit RPB2
MEEKLTYNDIWKIIELFLTKKNGNELIKHQIESYDLFLEKYIKDIIEENNPFIIKKYTNKDQKKYHKYTIIINNVRYSTPIYNDKNNKINIMYPENARKKNLTYTIPLCVDIFLTIEHIKNDKVIDIYKEKYKNKILGNIPLMVGSKYCNSKKRSKYDKGGYFIINGSDKVIVSQERMCDNIPLIFKLKDNKYSHFIEVRCNKNMTRMANVFKIKITKNSRILKTEFNNLKDDISLLILFKKLGAKTDKEILEYILGNNIKDNNEYVELLKPSFIELNKILDTIDNIDLYIKKFLINKTITIDYLFDTKVLTHIKKKHKLYYLGYITKKLLDNLLDRCDISDRDNFFNKRIETSGILMAQLFKKVYKNTLKAFKGSILKDVIKNFDININKYIKTSIIDNGLKFSLSTGNWNAKIGSDSKKIGVAQVLNRLTYSSTLSHLRRLNAPIGKNGKLIDPRKLHNSQYGYICVAESPEGHSVGLVKNLALSTNISTYSNPLIIENLLIDKDVIQLDNIHPKDIDKKYTKILLNGVYFGITNKPDEIINYLKSLRRKGRLSYNISFSFKININEIIIFTDEGRLLRPFFIVENNKLLLSDEDIKKIKDKTITWLYLLKNGIIEYLDINEIETSFIAINQKKLNDKKQYTHCEIHPSLIFGICASLVPFPEHNQAPRVVYQCAQGKQAIGINSTNVFNRIDTLCHILHYPQKPIVYTKTSDIIGMNDLPAGDNLIVAIATHTGFNQEDSVIFNRGAIERGLFHITFYRSYKTEEKKDMSALAEEKFCIPDKSKCIGIRQGSYINLNPDGMIREGSVVKGGDIIIGKMTPDIKKQYSSKKNLKYKDTSIQLRHNEEGIIDKVEVTYNADGYKLAKVKVRSIRIPEIADKVCSRHGQKGTIGLILDEENMPFTEDGIIPDIIINPHAIPSRMTIGQLIESVTGKIGASKGKFIDGTPFNKLDIDNINKEMIELGFDPSGNEVMYNGETGERIKTKIFIGCTYYQRLKHLVHDKIHARAKGPINKLTRQPTEGRSRDGGLRMGNMELDCLNAHGIAYYMQDKYINCSDKYFVYTCDICGLIANVNIEKNIAECKKCFNKSNFSKVSLPYASKLLFYEIGSMGITTRFRT